MFLQIFVLFLLIHKIGEEILIYLFSPFNFSVLLFESYSHNSEEVTLHWMAEPITLMKVTIF